MYFGVYFGVFWSLVYFDPHYQFDDVVPFVTDRLKCILIVGIHTFRNFDCIISVDDYWMKSYLDDLSLNPTCIPVKVIINNPYLVPSRNVSCFIWHALKPLNFEDKQAVFNAKQT